MNAEPALPVTLTHSGIEAKGTILGLEGRAVVPVLGAAVLSVLLVALMVTGSEGSLFVRLAFALCPLALTTAYVVSLVHRRPPHFARDVGWWAMSHARGILFAQPGDGLGFNTRPELLKRSTLKLS
ncbi:MAG: hypothetical protein SFV32_02145 [Opitutaceae bacterium]|nr:hypothetical protein [Opitutaceae bacterium]